MSHPPVSIALALSLLAGIATAGKLMPPVGHSFGRQHAMASTASLQKARDRCNGYETLHVLLRSARDAQTFRDKGRCIDTMMDADRPFTRFGRAIASLMR